MTYLLFTGSRAHHRPEQALDAISYFTWYVGEHYPHDVICMHGACPTKLENKKKGLKSIDEMVKEWCLEFDDYLVHDPHPANWSKFGLAAGGIRNREMSKLAAKRKAVACLALPDGKSTGTRNCATVAGTLGIPTLLIEPEQLDNSEELIEKFFKRSI